MQQPKRFYHGAACSECSAQRAEFERYLLAQAMANNRRAREFRFAPLLDVALVLVVAILTFYTGVVLSRFGLAEVIRQAWRVAQ